jgi:hypothetical protein
MFDLMFNRPRGHFQPREFHHRSQKIKSSFDSPDKCLVGMLLNVLLGERFIDDPDRRTQFPAARSENLGSTTNRVPVGKIQFSVFSFQFSVFSFQFSGCRVQGAGCRVQGAGCRILKSLPIRAIRFIRGSQSSHFLTRM